MASFKRFLDTYFVLILFLLFDKYLHLKFLF